MWEEFVRLVKEGDFPKEKIKTYPELEPIIHKLIEYLNIIGKNIGDEKPGEYQVGNKFHYILPIEIEGEKATYCFSFEKEGEDWYFITLETLTIPIYKVPELPSSNFPCVSEEDNIWKRAEIQTTKDIRLWNYLNKGKGKEFALDYFNDARGYALGVKTWLPFLPLEKAFVIYLCWEEANLYGNKVTLECLDENKAKVKFQNLIYLLLFKRTGHLSTMISKEDYLSLFESIWKNRCKEAGWDLKIKYDEENVEFLLEKSH